jgi:hypothetical protein
MSAECEEYEFMFGDTWGLITVLAQNAPGGEPAYKACPYVLGYRGATLRAVGDRAGKALSFVADTQARAIALASECMEDRFGPRRAAPAPTTSYVTSYSGTADLEEPPLQDERPDPITVLALERIRRGDSVIVTGERARLAPHRLGAIPPNALLATALEDIDKGCRGSVREARDRDS